MKKQSNNVGINVEQIALKLVKQQRISTDPTLQIVSEVTAPVQNEVKTSELMYIEDERYETLLNEIISLKQLLVNQQKYIEDLFDQQRDHRSLELLRESQEVKKQILQIAATQEKEEKKGFFSKFFNK